jgi:hypothetical protein
MKRKEFMLAGLLLLNGCAQTQVAQWAPKVTFAKKTPVHKRYVVKSCHPVWISLNDAGAEIMQTCPGSYREQSYFGLASSTQQYSPR